MQIYLGEKMFKEHRKTSINICFNSGKNLFHKKALKLQRTVFFSYRMAYFFF